MNINHLIKRIKEDTGLGRFLITSYSDHDIYDIIVNHALKDFEQFFSAEVEVGNIVLTGSRMGSDVVLIPDWIIRKLEICGLTIKGINHVRFTNVYTDRSIMGNLTANRMSYMSLGSAYAGIYDSHRQASSDIFQNYLNSCWYEKPNRLRFLYNDSLPENMNVSLSFRVSILPNLIGIPTGREHAFYKLAKLTVMKIIYENEGKYIDSIASGDGNLNIKIDEWQAAGDKRDELLEEMYNQSILDQAQVKILGD